MDRYIGMDVHAQTTTLAVMAASGKRLSEKVVETHARVLVDTLAAIAGDLHVCLEEGMHSEWLHELLLDKVADVMVVVAPERSGPKSDTRDAWWLAEQRRLGVAHKQVFKTRLSGLREAVRAHQAFTKHSTRAKLQLRFLARGRGLAVQRCQLLDTPQRRELIAQLPAVRRVRARQHSELVDFTEELRQQALEQLQTQAHSSGEVRRLMQVPGLGLVRAAQIVSAVVTPHRFCSREKFWSYCGLGVVTRSSSDWTPKDGRMMRSKRAVPRGLGSGNPTLKCAFKGAALDVVHHYPEHPWTIAYQRAVANGTRPHLAMLTLARKIAETVLHIWKHKEDYDSTQHKSPAA